MRGTLGFVVLDNFSSSILVILISNCGIVVFKQTCGMQFFTPSPPSPPLSSEPFLVSNQKCVIYCLLIISQHANGCYFFVYFV